MEVRKISARAGLGGGETAVRVREAFARPCVRVNKPACVCSRACVRACLRACVRVRAFMCACAWCVHTHIHNIYIYMFWRVGAFICVLVCLFVCLFASFCFVCFVCLFDCSFVCLFVCLLACLFVCLFIHFICVRRTNTKRAGSETKQLFRIISC